MKAEITMAKKPSTGKMKFVKYFGPLLDALRDLGDSARPIEVQEWIAESLKLSDEEIEYRYKKSGQRKFPNQVAFARQYLVWEGLLNDSERGIWTLTPKGKNTTLDYDKAHEIAKNWIDYFQEIRKEGQKNSKQAKKSPENDKNPNPVSITNPLVTPIGNTLKNENHQDESQSSENFFEDENNVPEEIDELTVPTLLEILQKVTPDGFEHLCGRLLREYGFEQIKITQRTRDGGIDGYGILKTNPFVNVSVAFQCKRWNSDTRVGSKDVQAFIGANVENKQKRCEKVLLITTSSFTKDALQIAERSSNVELIDGEQLVKMFEKVHLGVTSRTIYEPNFEFFKQYLEPVNIKYSPEQY